MNNATLQAFRDLAAAMQPLPKVIETYNANDFITVGVLEVPLSDHSTVYEVVLDGAQRRMQVASATSQQAASKCAQAIAAAIIEAEA